MLVKYSCFCIYSVLTLLKYGKGFIECKLSIYTFIRIFHNERYKEIILKIQRKVISNSKIKYVHFSVLNTVYVTVIEISLVIFSFIKFDDPGCQQL